MISKYQLSFSSQLVVYQQIHLEAFISNLYNVLVFGALAQLARALRWQRRGQEFESPMLHQIQYPTRVGFCIFYV